MDTTDLTNPFRTWAELTRGLRDRFVTELGSERPLSAYAGEVLGALAAMATRADNLGAYLQRMRTNDPDAYDAFLRAMENT